MPSLNFKARFAPLVESGAKRQTIRAKRRRPIKAGDQLYLFTGMRTKQCRRLMTAVCTRTVDFRLNVSKRNGAAFIAVDEGYLFRDEAEALARADGFKDVAEMVAWFKSTHGLPFHGQLIAW